MNSGDSEPIAFAPLRINVIPHISAAPTIPTTQSPGDPGAPAPTIPVDTMVPGGDFAGEFGGEFVDAPEPFTEEDCVDLAETIWNTPGMMLGDHLDPDPKKVAKFGRELYKYCTKKGIDPTDWFFDEFGLIAIGGSMAITMYRAHKEHKSETKYDRYKPDKRERETRVLDKPKKTENNDGIIQGEKTVYSEEDTSYKSETTEYAPTDNDALHEPVDEGELEYARL